MKISDLITDDKERDRISNSKTVNLCSAIVLFVVFIGLAVYNKHADEVLACAIASLAGVTQISRMYKLVKEGKNANKADNMGN